MSNIVQAKVTEIRQGGILVKIAPNGRKGFIRWRELAWERRITVQAKQYEIGDNIEARIIEEPFRGRYVALSIRQLTDPWKGVEHHYQVNQVVLGEVVNMRQRHVFVQLEPGIDALIPREELPLLADQVLDMTLSIGDKVQGVITHIDSVARQIQLSLNKRLLELSGLTIDQRETVQRQIFQSVFTNSPIFASPHTAVERTANIEQLAQLYRPPLTKLERLLIIDDNEDQLFEIWGYLERELQIAVHGAQSGIEAKTLLDYHPDYDLAIIDLRLGQERGYDVAEQLLAIAPRLEIIFTSTSPVENQAQLRIQGRSFPFVLKNPQEITGLIEKLLSGYWETTKTDVGSALQSTGSFLQELEMNIDVLRPLSEAFERMLIKLRQTTGVTRALLIEVDSNNLSANIVAIDPPVERSMRRKLEDGLYYSPVRNVAEEGEEFYITHRTEERGRQLQYFLPQLMFKTCFGLPIRVPHSITHHALFLLDKEVRSFSQYEFDQIRFLVRLTQYEMERAVLLDQMRRYEQRYTLGQLLSSLVHEASNKLDGFTAYIESLKFALQRAEATGTMSEQTRHIADASILVMGIDRAKYELSELIDSYSRTAVNRLEAVDVGAVAQKIKTQMMTRAREVGVEIRVIEQTGLPYAISIRARLEQILTNLVLNSIQQIEHQSRAMRKISRQRSRDETGLQSGLVLIQTQFSVVHNPFPLRIIVLDTGPGIHYTKQGQIFLMDTSMRREGHGLGLFISRSLVEIMGGRLYLADTILYTGSAFVVELPLFQETEAIDG